MPRGGQPCVIWLNHDGLMDADVARIVVQEKTAEVEGKQALPRTLEGEILSQETIKTNAAYI